MNRSEFRSMAEALQVEHPSMLQPAQGVPAVDLLAALDAAHRPPEPEQLTFDLLVPVRLFGAKTCPRCRAVGEYAGFARCCPACRQSQEAA